MIRTALYIRVSTEEQAIHGLSLDAQQSALIEYAKKHNLTVMGIYRDEGTTARKKLSQRKQFQKLMNDVEANKVDLILVTKLDRWFRNIRDYYNTQDILEKHNCNWQTIFEEYNTSTASGRLHINIMLSINQDECDRTSERIKAVQAHKLEQGQVISGKVPLGYIIQDKKLVKDPDTKDMMEDYWQHLLTYHSIRGSIKYIEGKYGKAMSYGTAKNFSRNETYAGTKRGIKNFCEPYLTPEQFEEIRSIVGQKNIRHRETDRSYIFTGLLRCPECNSSMSGHAYNDIWSYSYKCNAANCSKQKCSHTKTYNENKLEKTVLSVIQEELKKYKVELEVKAKNKKPVNISKQKAVLQKKITKLKELYLNELITLEEYKKDKADFEQQILELSNSIETVDYSENIKKAQKLIECDWENIMKDMDNKEKNALYRSIIDYIVPSEPIRIVFKNAT